MQAMTEAVAPLKNSVGTASEVDPGTKTGGPSLKPPIFHWAVTG